MKFVTILVVFLMMAPLEIYADETSRFEERMEIRLTVEAQEFHECISCNDNRMAWVYFFSCIRGLTPEHQTTMRTCCEYTFENAFCGGLLNATADYTEVCKDPKKGIEVENCYWANTYEDAADNKSFKNCKADISEKYCIHEFKFVKYRV